MTGEAIGKWDRFTEALCRSGICKNDEGNQIAWDRLFHRGSISVADTYFFICGVTFNLQHTCWFSRFWKTQVPCEIILYAWLAWRNKTLTWENLMKRGIHGPGQCVLCKIAEENNFHLLLDCPIAVEVWPRISILFSFTHMVYDSVDSCSMWWSGRSKRTIGHILCCFSWEIWKARNSIIFDGKTLNIEHILNNIVFWMKPLMQTNTMDKEIAPRKSAPHTSCPAGYVDGAA